MAVISEIFAKLTATFLHSEAVGGRHFGGKMRHWSQHIKLCKLMWPSFRQKDAYTRQIPKNSLHNSILAAPFSAKTGILAPAGDMALFSPEMTAIDRFQVQKNSRHLEKSLVYAPSILMCPASGKDAGSDVYVRVIKDPEPSVRVHAVTGTSSCFAFEVPTAL